MKFYFCKILVPTWILIENWFTSLECRAFVISPHYWYLSKSSSRPMDVFSLGRNLQNFSRQICKIFVILRCFYGVIIKWHFVLIIDTNCCKSKIHKASYSKFLSFFNIEILKTKFSFWSRYHNRLMITIIKNVNYLFSIYNCFIKASESDNYI